MQPKEIPVIHMNSRMGFSWISMNVETTAKVARNSTINMVLSRLCPKESSALTRLFLRSSFKSSS